MLEFIEDTPLFESTHDAELGPGLFLLLLVFVVFTLFAIHLQDIHLVQFLVSPGGGKIISRGTLFYRLLVSRL